MVLGGGNHTLVLSATINSLMKNHSLITASEWAWPAARSRLDVLIAGDAEHECGATRPNHLSQQARHPCVGEVHALTGPAIAGYGVGLAGQCKRTRSSDGTRFANPTSRIRAVKSCKYLQINGHIF